MHKSTSATNYFMEDTFRTKKSTSKTLKLNGPKHPYNRLRDIKKIRTTRLEYTLMLFPTLKNSITLIRYKKLKKKL